ncbi:hypothetical protein [Desulfonema ishimotonii]|uniref:hypothetical protein n=1 Tax=Desulfonema ishimotonii TaxID=45657 RepID=UPI000F57409B|nr:hypothetical protein [Desulfonema ishimotonii]
MRKRVEIAAYSEGISDKILTDMEDDGKQAIIAKTKKTVASAEDFELSLAGKLPDVPKPTVQAAVEDSASGIAEKQDGASGNIDSFVPD